MVAVRACRLTGAVTVVVCPGLPLPTRAPCIISLSATATATAGRLIRRRRARTRISASCALLATMYSIVPWRLGHRGRRRRMLRARAPGCGGCVDRGGMRSTVPVCRSR